MEKSFLLMYMCSHLSADFLSSISHWRRNGEWRV